MVRRREKRVELEHIRVVGGLVLIGIQSNCDISYISRTHQGGSRHAQELQMEVLVRSASLQKYSQMRSQSSRFI